MTSFEFSDNRRRFNSNFVQVLRPTIQTDLMAKRSRKWNGSPPTELVCPPDDVSCHHFGLSHTTTFLSNIRGRFSREHLHKFEDPCFGHLIDVDRIDWFGQLNHYTIFKAVKDKVTNDSISFLFGEDVATFRSREFCLISDLKFGEFPLEARGMSYTRERRRYP